MESVSPACVNAALLLYFIRKQGLYKPEPGWWLFQFKLLIGLSLMGAALWWFSGADAAWLTMQTIPKVIKVSWLVLAGGTIYFVSLWVMGIRFKDFSKRASS